MAQPKGGLWRGWQQHGQSRVDRQTYWEQLRQLSATESEDYLKIYDALAKSRAVTEVVCLMVDVEYLSNRVYGLAQDLVGLIGDMVQARQIGDFTRFRELQRELDEINIAVNAWNNRVCLGHGSVLYERYRQLRQAARTNSSN